jgi:DNA-directed RNA polymerase specialized sigma24 family protein
MKVIDFLESQTATLSVLVLALVAQTPHAADVFRLIVQGSGWAERLHSYSFAIALELAVLVFVVQKRQVESYGFALVSICMNLSYYSLHNVQLFSLASLPALLVSVALPTAIARYSHVVVASTSSATEIQHVTIAQAVRLESLAERQETVQVVQETVQDVRIESLAERQPDSKERAKQLRSEGLSNAQIAQELGVNASTISRWLNGASKVKA